MPRLADHDQRRAQITTAARKVIARGGLAAATFQSVAAEAGISVRLVQYYFGTKQEVLTATHLAVVIAAGERFARNVAALGESAPPRAILTAVFTELLPLDDIRREEAIILIAFHTAALTTDEVQPKDTAGPGIWLINAVTEQLRRARPDDDSPAAARRLDLDAQLLVGAVGGLTQGMLTIPQSAAAAPELVDHLLERFLNP
ncbi:TetR/AcrR family transcriptional regulator [Nocardia sp. NPDC057668]|uniref:TetR/AcrR family transcriptional regulator n=1 Tax=Nocardia sp. NPDC057668 TaxID=3346202 RepID=UPI00366A6EB1